jgi:hypothetical protein
MTNAAGAGKGQAVPNRDQRRSQAEYAYPKWGTDPLESGISPIFAPIFRTIGQIMFAMGQAGAAS